MGSFAIVNLRGFGALKKPNLEVVCVYTPSSSKAPKRIDSKPRGWITDNGGSIEFNTTPIIGNSTARAFNSIFLGAFELEGVYDAFELEGVSTGITVERGESWE